MVGVDQEREKGKLFCIMITSFSVCVHSAAKGKMQSIHSTKEESERTSIWLMSKPSLFFFSLLSLFPERFLWVCPKGVREREGPSAIPHSRRVATI